MYVALETPVELTVVVLRDVETTELVVEVVVVVENVLVEVNDVETDVEVAPVPIIMLVKPKSPVFPNTCTV